MKTIFASALVAATALTGAAHAATPQAQLVEIQKYAPNADVSTLSERDVAMAVAIIRSGDNESDKRQEVQNLLR